METANLAVLATLAMTLVKLVKKQKVLLLNTHTTSFPVGLGLFFKKKMGQS